MPEFHVEQYTLQKKSYWDAFVKTSKNGTFLFQRDFMDYHQDRFADFSLMVYKKNKLVAVFPANRDEKTIYSHQGLTYGGLVFSPKIKFELVLGIFQALLRFLVDKNIKTIYIKPVPKIYHSYPSDELDYLLFLVKAKLVRSELSATIFNRKPLKIQANRLEGVKKAQKKKLRIQKEKDFELFWNKILIPNLMRQHGTKPVHSAEEIKMLAENFPDQIHQFNVYDNKTIVGGVTIFETETVAHTQYISADENRQQLGTLDFLFEHLIEEEFTEKTYFDFGTSNENQGGNLNQGLLYWKECFGARGIVQNLYEIDPAKYSNLNAIFI